MRLHQQNPWLFYEIKYLDKDEWNLRVRHFPKKIEKENFMMRSLYGKNRESDTIF